MSRYLCWPICCLAPNTPRLPHVSGACRRASSLDAVKNLYIFINSYIIRDDFSNKSLSLSIVFYCCCCCYSGGGPHVDSDECCCTVRRCDAIVCRRLCNKQLNVAHLLRASIRKNLLIYKNTPPPCCVVGVVCILHWSQKSLFPFLSSPLLVISSRCCCCCCHSLQCYVGALHNRNEQR